MISLSTLLFICFLLPFCLSLNEWPVDEEQPLKDSIPVTGSFRVNLQEQASIIISHQSDIGVCFQRLFQVPAVENYKYCTTFIPLTSPSPVPTPSQAPVPAPDRAPAPSEVPLPGPVPIPSSDVVPVPSPGSVPAPSPGSVPAPVPVPIPESVPVPVPVPSPGSVPVPVPVPSPGSAPAPVPVPIPDSVPAPVPAPSPDSVPAPSPGSVPAPVPVPSPGSVPAPVPVPTPESIPPSFSTQKKNVKGQSKRSVISLKSFVDSPYLLDFADEVIYFGIYYLNAGNHNTETLHINFTGLSCNSSLIFNGTECEKPIPLENNQTVEVTVPYLQSIFYSIEVPERTRQLTVLAENYARVYLRYMGTPSSVTYDIQGQTSVTMDLPQKGTWYIRVVNDYQSGQMDLKVTAKFKQCDGNGIGLTCNNSILADVSKLDTKDVKANEWVYYKFISTPTNPLRVSVQTQSGKSPVQLYASVDQVPTSNHSYIKGCNQPNCESTTIILVNSTEITTNLTWYIGIVSTNDTTFGIWFSSVCAPNCNVNGKCVFSGVNTGLCQCGDPYIGFDCSIDNAGGLRPQYIVLIIIASLVLASVIIGLVAWLYMQRKQDSSYSVVADKPSGIDD